MDSTVADPMTGRVLDRRYRVGPRIARGGMASVYEATDLRLDRVCALKVMHPALGDDDDVAARFVREARAAARLSHPHVVAVFDQGDDDGTVFLAMEHVEGHTLRDLLRAEAPLPPERALALLDPVLSALAAAHAAGLIHRDVKPENVLLADDGRIKVADFGLARAVSAQTRHTSTGVLIGTVSYLSPELLVDGRADARCDVYAAGVVLYELLTGRKPHEGDSPLQVAYKHVHEDVPPPSRLRPGLPAYVDALVARATARDADLRPADARVMLHQVRRVRAALADGVHDDPELTSDLTPVVPAQRGWDEHLEEPGHAAPTVLAPAEAARAARTQPSRAPAAHRPSDLLDDRRGSRPDDRRGGWPTGRPADGPEGTELTGVIGTGELGAYPPRTADQHGARPARRRGPLLLVLVLLLAAGAGAGAWWLGAGRYTTTPGVLDLPARAAEARLARAGLGFEVTGRAWSETVPSGSVVSTDPEGGENVADGGTVKAVLSRGPERHDVPKVADLPLDRAQAAIADARLSFGSATYVWSPTVAEGVVLRADPRTGTSLRPDRAVDLVVSKGPKPVPVPDVTGDPLAEATRALRKLELEVETTRENDDTVPKGAVISQDPARGRLVPGESVALVVSKGPVLVDVPDVRRLSVDEARDALAEAGFGVRVVRLPVYVGLGVVVSHDPAGATRAPRGSTVTVSVV